ncbi:hypothetical protein FUMI01_12150 [Flavobacterium sp. UMI-01]|nr:hypothetical protein FUMI01_12150 [Flavobacterium sp. UMI-01]
MADTNNYTELQKLSYKDIECLLIVSEATAKRYYNDIKTTYNLRAVLYKHFLQYFKC